MIKVIDRGLKTKPRWRVVNRRKGSDEMIADFKDMGAADAYAVMRARAEKRVAS